MSFKGPTLREQIINDIMLINRTLVCLVDTGDLGVCTLGDGTIVGLNLDKALAYPELEMVIASLCKKLEGTNLQLVRCEKSIFDEQRRLTNLTCSLFEVKDGELSFWDKVWKMLVEFPLDM